MPLDQTIRKWCEKPTIEFNERCGEFSFLSNSSQEILFDFPETCVGGEFTIGPARVSSIEHVLYAFKALIAGHKMKSERVLEAYKSETCVGITGRRNMKMSEEQLERFNSLSEEIVFQAVRAKFADPENLERLKEETHGFELVEKLRINPDDKWGVKKDGMGRNLLGQMLMIVRDDEL